ncbi:PhnD/SsuA/transferrin family substrate-binding protein [Streptomyces lasalocidi]
MEQVHLHHRGQRRRRQPGAGEDHRRVRQRAVQGEVRPVHLRPALVQAAASGDIDLGSVGDVPPITGAAKEYGFKVVAVNRSLTPTQSNENIIVPKGSTLKTAADLKGKKIAVPQGSSAHGLALNALKSVGLTPKDVKLTFLDPAAKRDGVQHR